MTAPDTTADAPIPDHLLAQVFGAQSEPSHFGLPADDAPAQTPETPATDAEGTAAPVAADSPAPDAPATPETPASDPAPVTDTPDPLAAFVASGTPLTYKVDGASKTFDGIVEVEGKGAFVTPEALGPLREVLNRAEHATEANRTLYARTQEYEAAGGTAKLYELQEGNAALNAIVKKLGDALDHLDQFLVPDGQGGVTVDQRARDLFMRELSLEAQTAKRTVAGQRETQAAERQTAEQEAATTTEGIRLAVESMAEGLTPDDVAKATAHFARFASSLVKTATPDVAAQYGMKVGERYVDRALMVEYFTDLRTLRANQKAEADARKKAEIDNAKRNATPPKPVTPVKAPTQPRASDGTFREKPKPTREDFFLAALGGKPTPGTQHDDE